MPRVLALLLALTLAVQASGETPRWTLTVHADRVQREVPATIGGTTIHATGGRFRGDAFYREQLSQAGVGLIRSVTYPQIPGRGFNPHDLTPFDANARAIAASGAAPLLIQYITDPDDDDPDAPDLPYLTEAGDPGGDVGSNLVFLTRRYLAEPYGFETIYWEIGNEPDYTIDYKVRSVDDYLKVFRRVHEALGAAGLRDRVRLCGPAVISPYRFVGRDWFNTKLIDGLIDLRDAEGRPLVDVVTYHNYARRDGFLAAQDLPAEAGVGWRLLNFHEVDELERADPPAELPLTEADYGMSALLARLDGTDIRVGLTEYNAEDHQSDAAGGLYHLIVTRFAMLNPRCVLTTDYVFDATHDLDGLGHFRRAAGGGDPSPDFNYWALYWHHHHRGPRLLGYTADVPLNPAGHPLLLVTATRSGDELFVEVINRHDERIRTRVDITGLPGGRDPGPLTVYRLAESVLPDRPVDLADGEAEALRQPPFDATWPAMSATVFRYRLP